MDTASLLDEALKKCAATKFTGVLRVAGDPGGTVHLAGGGIAACDTSGAPGLEVILLRSRMISEEDWDAAFAASAKTRRPMTAELIARELVGAGELEALLRVTLADTMFALVNGTIAECQTEEQRADCLLPFDPAAKSGWLLAEATRRAQALASFPEPAISARDRVVAVPKAAGKGADEILAMADGRRTARDLAFALGRGLYATLLQLTQMRAGGLVVTTPRAPAAPSRGQATGLPRRRKDQPETSRRDLPAPVRMVRPRSD